MSRPAEIPRLAEALRAAAPRLAEPGDALFRPSAHDHGIDAGDVAGASLPVAAHYRVDAASEVHARIVLDAAVAACLRAQEAGRPYGTPYLVPRSPRKASLRLQRSASTGIVLESSPSRRLSECP